MAVDVPSVEEEMDSGHRAKHGLVVGLDDAEEGLHDRQYGLDGHDGKLVLVGLEYLGESVLLVHTIGT